MIRYLTLLVPALLPYPALFADMVVLSNGDKVSGTLIEVNGGKVIIDSPLIGTVNLLRTDVRSIRFGTPEQIEADITKENAVAIKEATKKAMAEKVAVNHAVANAQTRRDSNQKPKILNPANIAAPANALGQRIAPGNNELDVAMKQLQQLFPGGVNPGIANRGGRGGLGGLNGNLNGLGGGVNQSQVQDQLMKVLSGELGLGDIRKQAADASRELHSAKQDLQQMGAWSPMYDTYLRILDDFVGRVDKGEQLNR